ncbi:MAG TPA: DUF2817 domain-containing protein, partial [Pirellulales bacterium]
MRLKTAMRRGAITICWATVALIESGGAAWAQTQPAPIPVEAPKLGGFGAPFDPAAAANGPPPPLTPVAVERPSDASAPRPAVGWDEFGRTPDGRPLEKAQFGVGRRLVLFVGPLGGDEDGALAVVERLAGWFQEFPERLSDLRVMIVRTGNPDGFARGTRANARGVDLNRNFPTKGWRKIPHGNNWASGPEPASEPETEALIELIREQRPDLVWVVGSSPAAAFTSSNAGSQVVGAVIARHCGSNLRELSVGQASGGLAAYADELGLPTLATTLQDDAAPDDAWNRFGAAFLAGLTAVSLETSVAAPARLAPPVSFSEGNSPVLGSSPQMRRVGELGGVPAGDASFGSAAGSGGLVPLRRPGAAAPPPMFTGVNSALATREAPDAMVAVPPSGETTIPTDAGLR